MIKRLKSGIHLLRRQKIPAGLKNKYVLATLAFAVWMFFFDQNNMLIQNSRIQQLRHSTSKKTWYEKEIKILDDDRDALLSDKQTLEKFARENYMMKRPNEDIFIIIED